MSSLPPKVQALYFTRCWGPTTGGARAASPFQTKEYQKMRLMIVVGSSITERESFHCHFFVYISSRPFKILEWTLVTLVLMRVCLNIWPYWPYAKPNFDGWSEFPFGFMSMTGWDTPLPQGTDGSHGAWPFSGRQLSRAMNEWHVPWSKSWMICWTWWFNGIYMEIQWDV